MFIWEGHFCQGNQILHVYEIAVVGKKEGKMGFCFIGPNQQQFVLTQLFSYLSQKEKKKVPLLAKPRLRAAAFKAEKLSRCRCKPRSLAGHWYGGYRANTGSVTTWGEILQIRMGEINSLGTEQQQGPRATFSILCSQVSLINSRET